MLVWLALVSRHVNLPGDDIPGWCFLSSFAAALLAIGAGALPGVSRVRWPLIPGSGVAAIFLIFLAPLLDPDWHAGVLLLLGAVAAVLSAVTAPGGPTPLGLMTFLTGALLCVPLWRRAPLLAFLAPVSACTLGLALWQILAPPLGLELLRLAGLLAAGMSGGMLLLVLAHADPVRSVGYGLGVFCAGTLAGSVCAVTLGDAGVAPSWLLVLGLLMLILSQVAQRLAWRGARRTHPALPVPRPRWRPNRRGHGAHPPLFR